MGKLSEVIIVADKSSTSGYSLVWEGYKDDFCSDESRERFKPVESFRFVCLAGAFLARKELRGGRVYWYGFRRVGSRVRKTYLGKHDYLKMHHLEAAAARLGVTQ